MEESMAALAAAGGAAVVQAAGTDVWAGLRRRITALFGRGDAQREMAVLERLDRTAQTLGRASEESLPRRRAVQQEAWTEEFLCLLNTLDEDQATRCVTELRALVQGGPTAEGSKGRSVNGNVFNGPVVFQDGDHNHQDVRFGAAP